MPRPQVLELGTWDVLCTKFSEAEVTEELLKVTDAGTEKLEPQEHSFKH